jgi:MoxR-like ATPase
MQRAIERVHVAASVREYCVDLVAATRNSQSTAVGASPRGSLALLKLARCRAALRGRDYVLPDDVKAIAVPALAHRPVLRPELWVQRVSAEDVVREVLDAVPTPRAEDVTPSPAA